MTTHKLAHCAARTLLLVLILVSITATYATAERGRVMVKNGTVVSDKGTLLRGATMQLDSPDSVSTKAALDPNNWKAMHDLKLNVIRFDVKLSGAYPVKMTVAQQLPKIERAVELAEQNDMYIMLMNSVDPGTYDKKELLTFWSTVAPLYKNRRNVLFEMVNEPVAWTPIQYKASIISDLKEVFDAMRHAAPETHIVLWTFAALDPGPADVSLVEKMAGVEYRNETVGFHDYHNYNGEIMYLKHRYPLFMTETSYVDFNKDDIGALKRCDMLGISWCHLDGKDGPAEMQSVVERLNKAGVTWTPDWELPATAYSTATTQ